MKKLAYKICAQLLDFVENPERYRKQIQTSHLSYIPYDELQSIHDRLKNKETRDRVSLKDIARLLGLSPFSANLLREDLGLPYFGTEQILELRNCIAEIIKEDITHYLHEYKSMEQLDDCGYQSYQCSYYPPKDGNNYNPFDENDKRLVKKLFGATLSQFMKQDNMYDYLIASSPELRIPLKNKHAFFISCSCQVSFYCENDTVEGVVIKNNDDNDQIIDNWRQRAGSGGNFMNLTLSFLPIKEDLFLGKCFYINPSAFADLYHKELSNYLLSKAHAYSVFIDHTSIKINKLNYFATFSSNNNPLIHQLVAYGKYKSQLQLDNMIETKCNSGICLYEAYY